MNGSNGSTVLLDSNILIYYFENQSPYAQLVESWFAEGRISISVVTISEILAKASPSQKAFLERIISSILVIPIDIELAKLAGLLRRQLTARTKRPILLDCFIAATAINKGYYLATANRRDFPFKELKFAKFR